MLVTTPTKGDQEYRHVVRKYWIFVLNLCTHICGHLCVASSEGGVVKSISKLGPIFMCEGAILIYIATLNVTLFGEPSPCLGKCYAMALP